MCYPSLRGVEKSFGPAIFPFCSTLPVDYSLSLISDFFFNLKHRNILFKIYMMNYDFKKKKTVNSDFFSLNLIDGI